MAIQAEILKLRKMGCLVEAIGRVTNQTTRPLTNAWAVISYFNERGDLLQTDSARLRQARLMPGQTARFRVIGPWNERMVRGRIQVSQRLAAEALQECTRDEATLESAT